MTPRDSFLHTSSYKRQKKEKEKKQTKKKNPEHLFKCREANDETQAEDWFPRRIS